MKKFFVQFFKGLLYLALFFVLQNFVQFAAMFVIGVQAALSGTAEETQTLLQSIQIYQQHALAITALSQIIPLVVIVIILAARKKNIINELSVKSIKPAAIAPIVIGGLALSALIGSLIDILPIPSDVIASYEQSSSVLSGGNPVWMFIAVVLVAPVVEEVFLRGLVFTRFQRGMPTIAAMILSSALFGLLHGQIVWVAYTFVVGMILCAVFVRFKSLTANILLHASFNAFSLIQPSITTALGESTYVAVSLAAGAILVAAAAVVIIKITKAEKKLEETPEPVFQD